MRPSSLAILLIIFSLPGFGQYLYPDSAFAIHGDLTIRAFEIDGKSIVAGGIINFGDKDFDPGSNTSNPSVPPGLSFYLASYSYDGELEWLDVFQSSWPPSLGPKFSDLTIGDDRSVWAIGAFDYELDFDPSEDTVSLGGDETDPFILHLDSNGQLIDVVKLEGTNVEQPYSGIGLFIDHYADQIAAAIQVFGPYESLDLDPSSGDATLNCEGNVCGMLARYDENLNLQWHGMLAPQDSFSISNIFEMKIDDDDNLYVSATVQGSVDIDPSAASTIITTNNDDYNYLFLKINAQGALEWHKNYGSENRILDLELEADGSKIRGLLYGDAAFSEGSFSLPADSTTSSFLTYEEDGTLTNAFSLQFIDNPPIRFSFEFGKYYCQDGGNWMIAFDENGQVDDVVPNFEPFQGILGIDVNYGTVVALAQRSQNTTVIRETDTLEINSPITPHKIFVRFDEFNVPVQGVTDTDLNPSFKVFPNPNSGELYILSKDAVSVRVIGVNGREILSGDLIDQRQTIQTSNWPTGLYVIEVTERNGSVSSQRILKQ